MRIEKVAEGVNYEKFSKRDIARLLIGDIIRRYQCDVHLNNKGINVFIFADYISSKPIQRAYARSLYMTWDEFIREYKGTYNE